MSKIETALTYTFALALLSWPVYFAWVALLWLVVNIPAFDSFFSLIETTATILAASIIGLPIALMLLAFIFGTWSLAPVFIIALINAAIIKLCRQITHNTSLNQTGAKNAPPG